MFLEPGKPGRVKPKLLIAVSGFENRFGPAALALRVRLEFIEEVRVPAVVRKKFVGKLKPLLGLNGKPDRQRAVSEGQIDYCEAIEIVRQIEIRGRAVQAQIKRILYQTLHCCVTARYQVAIFCGRIV